MRHVFLYSGVLVYIYTSAKSIIFEIGRKHIYTSTMDFPKNFAPSARYGKNIKGLMLLEPPAGLLPPKADFWCGFEQLSVRFCIQNSISNG